MQYKTPDGQPITLRQRLDTGGEGAVWLTNFPETVAKLYHKVPESYVEKLRHMVNHPPEDPMAKKGHKAIAWPQDFILDEGGAFCGFLMPRVSGALKLNHVYNAKLRRRNAPGFNWYYLHVTALNLASILAALHEKGYVVGDLKTDNFLITDRALVSILDTDSFQITTDHKRFLCPVGSEGFTAPELIGKDFATTLRTKEQDAFGVGILIHLLLLGYHPFSGEFMDNPREISRDEAVSLGACPYQPHFQGKIPPYAMAPSILHPKVREAFERCFALGHINPEKRPSAQEWHHILKEALDDLVQCPNHAQHFHFGETCSWCARSQTIGLDVFGAPSDAQTLKVDFQFQRALDTQDLRSIANLWSLHPELHGNYRFKKHVPLIEKALKYVEALDHFKVFCAQTRDDEAILNWWLEHEDLSHFPHDPHELINNRPLHVFLKEVRERSKAFKDLTKALEQGEKTNRFGDRVVDMEAEQGIVDAYEGYGWPDSFKEKHPKVFGRVQKAMGRRTLWKDFLRAFNEDDDRRAYDLSQEEEGLLGQLTLTGAQKQFLMTAQQNEGTFHAFEALLQKVPASEDILSWWGAHPQFQRSNFCHKSIKGLSPKDHKERAERRKDLLGQMQNELDTGNFIALSKLWDQELCEGVKEFLPMQAMMQRAQRGYDLWHKVRRAAQEEDYKTVCAFWDEEAFKAPALKEGVRDNVQEAFRQLYGSATFQEPKVSSYSIHKDFVVVRWLWPQGCDDHFMGLLTIGTKRFFAKKKGDMGEATLPKVDTDISIQLVRKVCGDLLSLGSVHKIRPRSFPKVIYNLRFKKRAWQGWARKFGPKVSIELKADHALKLPALCLRKGEGRPPVFQEKGAQKVLSLAPLVLQKNEKKTYDFFLKDSLGTESFYDLQVQEGHNMSFDLVPGKDKQ